MAKNILDLPNELLDYISSFLDNDDNCSLRLLCKRLCVIATSSAFSNLEFRPNSHKRNILKRVLARPHLSSAVRDVLLETNTFPRGTRNLNQSKKAKISKEFKTIITRFIEFPNLSEVTLCYDRFEGQDRSPNSTFARLRRETHEYCNNVLQMIGVAIGNRNVSRPLQPVRRLSICSMHDVIDEAVMQDPMFQNMLSPLEELNLEVIHEKTAFQDWPHPLDNRISGGKAPMWHDQR